MAPVESADVESAIPIMTARTLMSMSDSIRKKTGAMSVETARDDREKSLMFRTVFLSGAVYVDEETAVMSSVVDSWRCSNEVVKRKEREGRMWIEFGSRVRRES